MKIYLAGPMRGIPYWNYPAFKEAAALLIGMGHVVYNPAALSIAIGSNPPEDGADLEAIPDYLETVIQLDIICIIKADALAVLPGWARSKGAIAEVALALFLNKPIYQIKLTDSSMIEQPYRIVPHLKVLGVEERILEPLEGDPNGLLDRVWRETGGK